MKSGLIILWLFMAAASFCIFELGRIDGVWSEIAAEQKQGGGK